MEPASTMPADSSVSFLSSSYAAVMWMACSREEFAALLRAHRRDNSLFETNPLAAAFWAEDNAAFSPALSSSSYPGDEEAGSQNTADAGSSSSSSSSSDGDSRHVFSSGEYEDDNGEPCSSASTTSSSSSSSSSSGLGPPPYRLDDDDDDDQTETMVITDPFGPLSANRVFRSRWWETSQGSKRWKPVHGEYRYYDLLSAVEEEEKEEAEWEASLAPSI